MEQETAEEAQRRSTPWGLIVGLILILAIVVGGAYYSFTKRYQPTQPASNGQSY